jgi:hypothetical protein
MSGHDHDFDEFLRHVLREHADAVEPGDDGLERIRARLTRPRPAPLVWVMAVCSGAWRRVQGTALSAPAWLRTLADGTSARLRPPGGGRPRRWRSPAVLAACAAIAVVAGVLALTPLPQQAVSGTAGLIRSLGGGHAGGGAGHGGGQAAGSGGQPAPGAASSSPAGKQAHRHPSASPGPSTVPSPTPDPGSASSSPAASSSPTPVSSSTPCPSASASPSPSPSSSPSPSPSPCATQTTGPTTGPTTDPTTGVTPNPAP